MASDTVRVGGTDHDEEIRRRKQVEERSRGRRRGSEERGGGKRHRHDARSAHFRLRSARKS